METKQGYTYHADTYCFQCVPTRGRINAALYDNGMFGTTDDAALPISPDSEWDYQPTCATCDASLDVQVIGDAA